MSHGCYFVGDLLLSRHKITATSELKMCRNILKLRTFLMGQFWPFLFIFIRFTIQLQICKAVDVVDGFEPGAAGWKVHTDPNVLRPAAHTL